MERRHKMEAENWGYEKSLCGQKTEAQQAIGQPTQKETTDTHAGVCEI